VKSDVIPGPRTDAPEAGSFGLWTTLVKKDLPLGSVELIEYDLQHPVRQRLAPDSNYIELLLIEYPLDRLAWLPHAAGAHMMGDIVFFIPNQVIEINWPAAGRLRAVRCGFRLEPSYPLRPFTLEERLAALDVRSPEIHKALHAILGELLSPGFQSPVLLNSLSGQIAVELGRYLRRHNRPPAARLNIAQMKLVDERIEAGGNLPKAAEMAERCQLSKRHFFRLFRLTTGMSFKNYASRRRTERAKELLRRKDMVVKQVAFRCGFQTPSAFSAAFRQVTGMTPREYRLTLMDRN
jgi:AraC family transcriptional regulator